MERTFTLHLYLQGNEGPVFPETFYFVSKHPAGDNLQVHHSSELAYGSTEWLRWMRGLRGVRRWFDCWSHLFPYILFCSLRSLPCKRIAVM
jgi:hypothetical protein